MENKVKKPETAVTIGSPWKATCISVPCALKGCHPCPYPDTCDGYRRMCDFWKKCSSK